MDEACRILAAGPSPALHALFGAQTATPTVLREAAKAGAIATVKRLGSTTSDDPDAAAVAEEALQAAVAYDHFPVVQELANTCAHLGPTLHAHGPQST